MIFIMLMRYDLIASYLLVLMMLNYIYMVIQNIYMNDYLFCFNLINLYIINIYSDSLLNIQPFSKSCFID
jgi:hypothetical protein